jgi:hypothetical protein
MGGRGATGSNRLSRRSQAWRDNMVGRKTYISQTTAALRAKGFSAKDAKAKATKQADSQWGNPTARTGRFSGRTDGNVVRTSAYTSGK